MVNERFKNFLSENKFIFSKTALSSKFEKIKLRTLSTAFGDFNEKLFGKISDDKTSFFNFMKHAPLITLEEKQEMTFFFAGLNAITSCFAIAQTLYLLARNPDVQEKLYEELTSILDSDCTNVTADHLSKMVLLDNVIKESMRLLPSTLVQGRKVTGPLKLKNYTLPKGSEVLIPTLAIHTDVNLWGDDAMEFRPERFEHENFKSIHPYSYLPFSRGSRMCIGVKYATISMKVYLSRFLMKFKLTSDIKYEDLVFTSTPTLKATQPLILLFESREH